MVERSKISVRLSDSQLNKLKPTFENQTFAILRMNINIFHGNNLAHELLLTRLLEMLLGTLRAILFENMLPGKEILRAGYENKIGNGMLRADYGNKKGKRILRGSYESKMDF